MLRKIKIERLFCLQSCREIVSTASLTKGVFRNIIHQEEAEVEGEVEERGGGERWRREVEVEERGGGGGG